MNQQLTVYDLVNQQESFFSNAMTVDRKDISWNKESQFAIQALSNNDYLCSTAMKNPASMQNGIINIAAVGISLNPALKHAYLVPRKVGKGQAVCLDISYQGLMHIAMQSGCIEWGQAKIVYKNDQYTNNGIDQPPTHKQDTFGAKGEIVGVYCTVKTKSGDYLTEEMDIEAIRKIQNASQAKNGPWSNWWEEMARKTVVKRAYKYWPKAEAVSEAVAVINEHEGIDFDNMKEVEAPKRTNLQAFADNKESVVAIREAFEEERYSDVVMYWDEITGDPEGDIDKGENDKSLLWVAPTKYQQYGLTEPVFSTELRKFLKESASQYR